jgi:hypothetical protein
MHPGNLRGTINTWNQVVTNFGSKLSGKTISQIEVAYDYAPSTGQFRGYIDDITISDSGSSVTPTPTPTATLTPTHTPTPSGFPVPGQIQAESYNAMSGVQLETTTDTGGGQGSDLLLTPCEL